jgi:hypothetical protein
MSPTKKKLWSTLLPPLIWRVVPANPRQLAKKFEKNFWKHPKVTPLPMRDACLHNLHQNGCIDPKDKRLELMCFLARSKFAKSN